MVFSHSKSIPQPSTQPRDELTAVLSYWGTSQESVSETSQETSQVYGKPNLLALDYKSSAWFEAMGKESSHRNQKIHWMRYEKEWRYINTINMMADLATRKGVKLSEVHENFSWFIGLNLIWRIGIPHEKGKRNYYYSLWVSRIEINKGKDSLSFYCLLVLQYFSNIFSISVTHMGRFIHAYLFEQIRKVNVKNQESPVIDKIPVQQLLKGPKTSKFLIMNVGNLRDFTEVFK